jgi:glycosyltransferase involved in cell wall biosynthesis
MLIVLVNIVVYTSTGITSDRLRIYHNVHSNSHQMNILGLTHYTSGCGYHRIILPLGYMQDTKAYATNMITQETAQGWDVMLFNRICPYDHDFETIRKDMGCKIVVDLDDYWKLPPNHINAGFYEKTAERIERNIAAADLVTVSNEAVAKHARKLNNNVVVLPNALPFGLNQYNDFKQDSQRVRILWAGSVTHEHDLKIIRNPVARLKQYSDKIQMVMAGYNDTDAYTKSIWDRMFSSFTMGGQLPYMKIHSLMPAEYMAAYEYGDIMVIPLESSEWHSCKSNLKILEAAAKRIPVIVSNVAPYNQDADAPVLWVNKQSDWFEHLKYLINNEEARKEYGEKLYQWAVSKYNLADVNTRRREAFANLCSA